MKTEYLKVGEILVPKPQFEKLYPIDTKYIVTEDDVKKHATIGEKWMIKL